MKKILAEINKTLAEKLASSTYINEHEFEKIYFNALAKLKHKISTFDIGKAKQGFKTVYLWGGPTGVTPFKFKLLKTKRSFDGRDKFSITGCLIEDFDIQNCQDKDFDTLVKECSEKLQKKVEKHNSKLKALEDKFAKTLASHDMTLETFLALQKLDKEIKEF